MHCVSQNAADEGVGTESIREGKEMTVELVRPDRAETFSEELARGRSLTRGELRISVVIPALNEAATSVTYCRRSRQYMR